jgi:hypothetical protein
MPERQLDEWDFSHGSLRSLSAPEIRRFWDGYIARRGDGLIVHGSLYSRWRILADDLVLSLYVANRSVGLFVRGQRGESFATTASRLSAYEPGLGRTLGAGLRDFPGCCYLGRLPLAATDPASWPQCYEWLEREEERYCRALNDLVLRGPAGKG